MKIKLASKWQDAFTLIELMFVTSILALLIGLIAVGLSRHREKAIAVACLNNLRAHGPDIVRLLNVLQGGLAGQSSFGQIAWIEADGGGMLIDGTRHSVGTIEGSVGGRFAFAVERVGSSGGIAKDFQFCPAVDADPDYSPLIDPDATAFKGYGLSLDQEWASADRPTGGYAQRENAVDVYIKDTGTYARNTILDNRPGDITPETIAYIDWNAAEGWGSEPYPDNPSQRQPPLHHTSWRFNNPARGIATGTSKGDNWWKTEVGFHHMGGANYITWDCRGGWIHSNDIDLVHFDPASAN